MGIPRLTRDLTPYLESVIITNEVHDESSEILSRKFVIDGPSMVYFVYRRLAAYKQARTQVIREAEISILPTYTELSLGVTCFLEGLQRCGAIILNIFFDGALPLTKRAVRLERLEKSRKTLELERLTNPTLKVGSVGQVLSSENVRDALWKDGPGTNSVNLYTPFIVPSAIDGLKGTQWAEVTQIVHGEADAFCVPVAAEHDAMILSDDSDLIVYPQMEHGGTVVPFRGLRMITTEAGKHSMEVQLWDPGRLRSRLNVPSLLSLAYHRKLDPTASFNALIHRSLSAGDSLEPESTFVSFRNEYNTHADHHEYSTNILESLDPRLSELVWQLKGSTNGTPDLLVTLPTLLEDPTRDASWEYGKIFRKLAYSILVRGCCAQDNARNCVTAPRGTQITEVYRKGPRVAHEQVMLDIASDQLRPVTDLLDDLQSMLTSSSKLDIDGPRSVLYVNWAAKIAQQERGARSKSFPPMVVAQLLGTGQSATSSTAGRSMSWDVVHLNANVHAILYSLRILKQAVTYIGKQCDPDKPGDLQLIDSKLVDLVVSLDPFPEIRDLFLNILETRALMQKSSHLSRLVVTQPDEESDSSRTQSSSKHDRKAKRDQRGKRDKKNATNRVQKTVVQQKQTAAGNQSMRQNMFSVLEDAIDDD